MNKYIERLRTIKENQDGFSLIELVVAVGILAILSVVGVVAYSKITENARKTAVEAAAAEVYTGAVAYDANGDSVEDAADEWNNSSKKNKDGKGSITVKATKNGDEICVEAKMTGYEEFDTYKGAGCNGSVGGDTSPGSGENTDPPVITPPATTASCFDFADGTITYYNVNKCGTDVVIPETIDGQAVETIGDYAFSNNQLTSVVFNEGLITIGESAFADNQLKNIEFPGSLKTIGEDAFLVNALTSVKFNEGLETIGGWAFHLNNLKSVEFPSSLKTIGEQAFLNNDDLKSVRVSKNTLIDDTAFNISETEIIYY